MTALDRIVGLIYRPGFLGPSEQTELLQIVDAQPWSSQLRRRVQHYGYRYDYQRRTIGDEDGLGPLPAWALRLARRLGAESDQLIVNEYLPGQGIASHVDSPSCFGDVVMSVSLGSTCVMTLNRPDDPDASVALLLEPGSLLVLTDEARYAWRHGIPARRTDRVHGRVVSRGRRVSLTFRSVRRRPQGAAKSLRSRQSG
ncbi:MAG TPA: alpha-ketoglutarate-dependent dioxygenase AlkB [Pilimelia sp.]|nr:alpha-ketoglutarate-dependent dioxygenase AlkB [Pilimelia sp.]